MVDVSSVEFRGNHDRASREAASVGVRDGSPALGALGKLRQSRPEDGRLQLVEP